MTEKELLLKEIESLPDSLLTEVLDAIRYLKTKQSQTKIKTPEHLGYSPGFFEEVAGGWAGEPLVRPEQGEYEQREELI